MNTSYVPLAAAYLLFLLVSARLSRGRFSPAIAFFVTWSVSLGLLAVGPALSPYFLSPPLSDDAANFLLAIGGCFLSGTFVAHAVGKPRLVRQSAKVTPAFELRLLQCLAAASLLLAGFALYRDAANFREYLTNASAIRAQLTSTDAQGSAIGSLATYAALVVTPVAAVYWLYFRRIRWWQLAPLLAIGLLSIAAIGKLMVIFLSLTFINQFLYHQRVTSRRMRRGPLIVTCMAVATIFVVTTYLRNVGRTDNANSRSGLAVTIFDYATGYVPAFSGYFAEYLAGEVSTSPVNPDYDPSVRRFGNQTFSGVYRTLAQLGLLDRSATNRYDGAFNVYTIYRDLVMDFGVTGTYVAIFFLSLVVTLFYRFRDPRNPSQTLVLSLATTQIEFTLIYSLFGFVFFPLMLICSPLFMHVPRAIGRQDELGASAVAPHPNPR